MFRHPDYDYYRNRQELHQAIMALTFLKADPQKIESLIWMERERMGVDSFIEHQYGHQWDSAHVRKTYSTATNDIPTGAI